MNAKVRLDQLISWGPVLLLAALAGLTFWLDAQVRAPTVKFDGSNRHDPDIYVKNFKAVSLDAAGRPHQSLSAQTALHFPDDDTTTFEMPEIAFTDPGKPRLDVTSLTGSVTGDRKNAYFSGHVKAVRQATSADSSSGPVTFTRERMRHRRVR